jgi:threonine aldolase
MASADVGDDVYGEDPVVNELQGRFADRIGKEAALLLPSGTMGNQIALRVLTRPGTLALAGRRQHILAHEMAAGPLNAGVQFCPLADDDGTISEAEVEASLAGAVYGQGEPAVLCLENTHMAAQGAVWSVEKLDAVALVASASGLPVHLDGARLFNAEVASGVPASRFARPAATVMCCLSKGLGAPIGSLLAGPIDLIKQARRERQRMGGGMRQAGILAAAGLLALETMVDRLAEDHARARVIARAVADQWPDAIADPDGITTNIVIFSHRHPAQLVQHLRDHGVLAGTVAPGLVRLVTHYDVTDAGIERVRKAMACAPA